jgi:hypothetical protein
MEKYFTSNVEALQFIKDNNIVVADYSLKELNENIADVKEVSMFNIENCSQAVYIYHFHTVKDAGTNNSYWRYNGRSKGIMVNNQIYYLFKVRHTNDKWELLHFPHDYKKLYRYEYNEKQPNYIGKATSKKVLEWANFVNKKYEYQMAQYELEKAKNLEFANQFKEKYPEGIYKYNSEGWCTRFEIYTDVYHIIYESGADEGIGNFYRKVNLRYDKIPSNEELLK